MIEMPSVPQYVTRFYGDLDFALDVVANRQITFVGVSTLNDPFDPYFSLETDFGGSRDVLLKHIAAEHPQDLTRFKANITDDRWQDTMTALEDYYSRLRSGMFVFSTCTESADFHPRDNLYMWGHYANGHRGVAIEFDTAKLESSLLKAPIFTGESESLKDNLWTKIEYRKAIPQLTAEEYYQFIMHKQNAVSESDRPENREPTSLSRHIKFLDRVKSDVWEHENEWRLMCSSTTHMKIFRCPISADSIKTITMGLKSSEEAHSNFAAEAVENFPQAVVFRAKKREGFVLDFERIFHPPPTSSKQPPAPTLDNLLDLDGQVLVVDPTGGHWVRFAVTPVPASPEKPHGIDYTLTLHGPNGERLVGFDNAHPVARQKRGEPRDHRHRLRSIRPYEYKDTATLLADFWTTVDAVLREKGVIP